MGVALSVWQSAWTEHIINTINPLLELEYDHDESKIMAMLQEKGLLDVEPSGKIGDRSYSVLEKVVGGYEAKAYALAFPSHVLHVKRELEALVADLSGLVDEDFGQKEAYIAYFNAIKEAFVEEDRAKLIGKWAQVDRTCMAITSPIQVGHPLKYY